MTGQDTMVRVDGLVRRYGDLAAVDGISFTVERGEMFGLIGPDGAGKTTTLRVLLGLLAPHGGTVRTCGLEPLKPPAGRRFRRSDQTACRSGQHDRQSA